MGWATEPISTMSTGSLSPAMFSTSGFLCAGSCNVHARGLSPCLYIKDKSWERIGGAQRTSHVWGSMP